MIYALVVLASFGFFFSLLMLLLSLPDVKKAQEERRLLKRALFNVNQAISGLAAQKPIVCEVEFINDLLIKIPYVPEFASRMQKLGVNVNLISIVLACFLTFSLAFFVLTQLQINSIISLVLSCLCVLAPMSYLRVKISIRRKKFEAHFIDALGIIRNGLKAGQGLTSALRIVSEDASWPVNIEVKKMLAEVEHGFAFDDALERLGKRINLSELAFFISTIKIQRQAGGNLAEIIENIEQTIRTRFELKREVATLSAQGRMSGIVLVMVPAVLFVVLNVMNPGFLLPLLEDPLGLRVLLLALVMGGIGIFWIYRVVNIKI